MRLIEIFGKAKNFTRVVTEHICRGLSSEVYRFRIKCFHEVEVESLQCLRKSLFLILVREEGEVWK